MKYGLSMGLAEYHADPAIGKTTLDLIARDPYLVEWSRAAPVDTSKTEALDPWVRNLSECVAVCRSLAFGAERSQLDVLACKSCKNLTCCNLLGCWDLRR